MGVVEVGDLKVDGKLGITDLLSSFIFVIHLVLGPFFLGDTNYLLAYIVMLASFAAVSNKKMSTTN